MTLVTGVSRVTESMPIRASIRAIRISTVIAMYLINAIFSLYDLRGPSADRDASYRPRPVAGVAPHLPTERFRRGLGNLFLSRNRRTVAGPAHAGRQTARHLRSGRLHRAPAPVP